MATVLGGAATPNSWFLIFVTLRRRGMAAGRFGLCPPDLGATAWYPDRLASRPAIVGL